MNKTLGDVMRCALARMKSNGAKPEVVDNATHFVYDYIESDLLDAYIIPDANVMVTKEGLENAAKAAQTQAYGTIPGGEFPPGEFNPRESPAWQDVIRAAFEAAGIVCPAVKPCKKRASIGDIKGE